MGTDLSTLEQLVDAARSWAVAHLPNAIRIVLIPAGAWLVTRIVSHLIRRLEQLAEDEDKVTISEREKRARTLGRILRQSSAVLTWGVAVMLVLSELGVDLKPILAGAGIAGLALGFGAQTLVRDIIAGFFILLENQFRVNDVISAAGVTGLVDSINLRTTVLRDVEGRMHVIPNGQIGVVTNFTQKWSRAVLDVGVAYKEDVDRCLAALREVGAGMETDPLFGPKLIGPFEYPGVERLDESAVVLRMMVNTRPQERWNVLRELRRRVKQAFDRHGIEMPFPHRTIYLAEGRPSGRAKEELQSPTRASGGAPTAE